MRGSTISKTLGLAIFAGSLFVPFLAGGTAAADEAALWKALREGGHAVLMRHAVAPGSGDPAQFSLRDCSTQRNLSAAGRAQAVRIGQRLKDNGIDAVTVYSSQWCRCLHTAELLAIGPVEELPIINSFFRSFENRDRQTEALRSWLKNTDLTRPPVLVTHQVNITALTGVFPSSGEMVIVRRESDGRISVAGSIETD